MGNVKMVKKLSVPGPQLHIITHKWPRNDHIFDLKGTILSRDKSTPRVVRRLLLYLHRRFYKKRTRIIIITKEPL